MILLQKQKYSGGDKNNGLLQTSGAKIAEGLGLNIVTPRIIPRNKSQSVLNWGVPIVPTWANSSTTFINHPFSIRTSSNKLKSFQRFSSEEVSCVPWIEDREAAKGWVEAGGKVVCRTSLTGCSGEGIVIAKIVEELVNAPLYTLYIKKKWEFRVHVLSGMVIHIQQKRKLTPSQLEERGITNPSKYIRNLENGYIFSSNLDPLDSTVFDILREESIKAVGAVDLHFGAVDLVVSKEGGVWVLEVNSTPGLEGTTLTKYIEAFKEYLDV